MSQTGTISYHFGFNVQFYGQLGNTKTNYLITRGFLKWASFWSFLNISTIFQQTNVKNKNNNLVSCAGIRTYDLPIKDRSPPITAKPTISLLYS